MMEAKVQPSGLLPSVLPNQSSHHLPSCNLFPYSRANLLDLRGFCPQLRPILGFQPVYETFWEPRCIKLGRKYPGNGDVIPWMLVVGWLAEFVEQRI